VDYAVGYNLGPADLGGHGGGSERKWKAEFTTPDGTARSNTFNFKAEGRRTLTGTVAARRTKRRFKRQGQRGRNLVHRRAAVRQFYL